MEAVAGPDPRAGRSRGVTDFVDSLVRSLEARLTEVEQAVEEYRRLEAARDALVAGLPTRSRSAPRPAPTPSAAPPPPTPPAAEGTGRARAAGGRTRTPRRSPSAAQDTVDAAGRAAADESRRRGLREHHGTESRAPPRRTRRTGRCTGRALADAPQATPPQAHDDRTAPAA